MEKEKQLELMYLDTINVLRDAKLQLSSITKWVVGLNTGSIVLSFNERFDIGFVAVLFPIFVLFFGALYYFTISKELKKHRTKLGEIREAIGGYMVDLYPNTSSGSNYNNTKKQDDSIDDSALGRLQRKWSEYGVLIGSSLVTIIILIAEAY